MNKSKLVFFVHLSTLNPIRGFTDSIIFSIFISFNSNINARAPHFLTWLDYGGQDFF